MKSKADLEARIAVSEQAADLTKQINATQSLIDKSREKAAVTEFKSSPIVNQTKFVSQLATVSLEPGAAALTWAQIAIGFLIALVTTFLTPYAFYLAFGDMAHKASASRAPANPAAFKPFASTPSVPPIEARYAPAPQPTTTERHTHQMMQPIMVDDSKWKAMVDKLMADHRVPEIKAA
jgi:hypothetical protein